MTYDFLVLHLIKSYGFGSTQVNVDNFHFGLNYCVLVIYYIIHILIIML